MGVRERIWGTPRQMDVVGDWFSVTNRGPPWALPLRHKEQPWPNEELLGHQGGSWAPALPLCAGEPQGGFRSQRAKAQSAREAALLGSGRGHRRAPPGVCAARVPLGKGGSCGAAAGCGATSRGSLPGSAASGGRASVLRPQLERFPLKTRRNASRNACGNNY